MKICNIEEAKKEKYVYLFDRPEFHEINEDKVDKVLAFFFGDKKNRAGMILGRQGSILKAPYSSPFSMIELFKETTIQDMDQYISELIEYSKSIGISEIQIKLPPMIYDETNITKALSAFLRHGFSVDELEINFQFIISNENIYLESLHRNAKKNLNHAKEQGMVFRHCESEEDKYLAYCVIKENRESKNYYLSMSWDAVKDTIAITDHDFFLLYSGDIAIASAVVFRVTEDVYQVIYWGDIPGYSELRPINYLAYELYKYYLGKSVRVLDIGPSMIDGHPNYGLCEFKEGIGCSASSKFVISKTL